MPVAGNESLSQLRSTLVELIQRGDEMHQRNLKGELAPDEVAEMKDLGDEITSYEAAIKAFPTADDFRTRLDGTKTFLRQRATPAPPVVGQDTRGDGQGTKARGHDGGGGSPFSIHGASVKSLGEFVVDQLEESARTGGGWKFRRSGQNWGAELKGFDRIMGAAVEDGFGNFEPYKAAFTTSGAGLTAYERRPGVVDIRQQRLTVADLFQQGQLNFPNYMYVRETSYTNNAATVAEGGTKPEAALATEEVTATAKKIAVWKKFSEELLNDYAGLRSWIDGRLRFMVLQEEEDQLLNGDGTGTNFEGILQVTGVQTESAVSAADNIEAVHRGITKVRSVGFSEPNGLVIHPTDYQTLRLTRDANDQMYGGGPFTGAYGNGPLPVNPGVWGMRTVITTAIAAGTVLVGDFDQGQFFRLNGVTVQMTNTDQDDFIKNLITILAEERGLLAIYRPTAFTAITLSAA